MDFILSLDKDLIRWAQAFLVLLLFYPAGLVLKKVVLFSFQKWAGNTENKYDDIIAARSGIHLIFWAFLTSFYIAARIAPVAPKLLLIVNKAVFSFFFLSLSIFIANVISDIIKTYTSSHKMSVSAPLTSLTENLIKLAVISIGVLIVLTNLGISITPLLTALGVGSLAVALALQDTLTNLFSGFYIIANRQVHTGDYIRLDSGQEGYVIDIGWRATRIRQLSNNIVLIPNGKLGSSIVINFNLPEKEMAIAVPVSVSYSSDLDKVERVTVEVAKETLKEVTGGCADFTPAVRFTAFGDSAISFNVGLRVKDFTDQYLITHEFIKRLHKRFNKEGIEMPFPQMVVHLPGADKK